MGAGEGPEFGDVRLYPAVRMAARWIYLGFVWPLARKGAPPLAIPGPRRQSSPPTGLIGALGSLAVQICHAARAPGPFSSGQEAAVHLVVFWPSPGQGPVGRLPVRFPSSPEGACPWERGAPASSLAGIWAGGLVSCHFQSVSRGVGEGERGGREKGVQHSGQSTGMFGQEKITQRRAAHFAYFTPRGSIT